MCTVYIHLALYHRDRTAPAQRPKRLPYGVDCLRVEMFLSGTVDCLASMFLSGKVDRLQSILLNGKVDCLQDVLGRKTPISRTVSPYIVGLRIVGLRGVVPREDSVFDIV